MATRAELINRRNELWNEYKSEFRKGDDADQSKLDKLDGELRAMNLELEMLISAREDAMDKAERTAGHPNAEARWNHPLSPEARWTNLPRDPTSDAPHYEDREAAWDHFRTQIGAATRTQTTLTGGAGGYLVPDSVSREIYDLARAQMRTSQAGVRTVPLAGGDNLIVVEGADPTVSWRGESEALSESQAAFEVVSMSPKDVSCIVRASREVLNDSMSDLGQLLGRKIAAAFALELDRIVLYGSGVNPEPIGVSTSTAVGETTSVGTPVWADLVAAKLAIANNNYDPNAVILSHRDESTLTTTEVPVLDSTDTQVAVAAYLGAPSYVANMPRYTTNQISITQGGGSNESEIFVAEWRHFLLGVRESLSIQFLRERFADVGEVAWACHARVDTLIVKPEAFHVLRNTTA